MSLQRAPSTRLPLVLDRTRQASMQSAENLYGRRHMTDSCINQASVMLMKTVEGLVGRYHEKIVEEQIAKHAAAVLQKTKIGKEMLKKVEEMHDDDLDDFLKELGKSD